MIEQINKKQSKRFKITILCSIIGLLVAFYLAISIGHYGVFTPARVFKTFAYFFSHSDKYYSTDVNVIGLIRIPRTIGAFLIGGALSVAGLIYQNTFNNRLVSPDILGVSAGCCVGAGVAILLGLANALISIFAFCFGILAVFIALLLPKIFRNKSSITLVLSGIIVGSFMNSIIGIIKYTADKVDKLSSIVFWMMGSLAGTTYEELIPILIIVVVCFVVLLIMNFRIDAISLGREEAMSIGVNYKVNRLIVILCSTLLTASSVAICGNVGWVGLVIPHISRAIVGSRSKENLVTSFFLGGVFMIVVDTLSRTLAVNEVPLSIITGLLGAVVYACVLIKKGRMINE